MSLHRLRPSAASILLFAACATRHTPPAEKPATTEQIAATGGAPAPVAPAPATPAPAAPASTAPAQGGSSTGSVGASTTTTPAAADPASAWTMPALGETGDPAGAGNQGWSIITTAPEGITAADLGRPLDGSFQLLAGTGPVFRPKAPERYPGFRHSASIVQDQLTLTATVRAWNVNLDANGNRRFATYRAEQIAEVHAVDDMASPRPAPPGASFYISKVFYGRSYEVRLSGDDKRFNLSVAGAFMSGKVDGGLKVFAERNRLEFTALGRGLRPRNDGAIFAKSPSEIEDNYTVNGESNVPVSVEYRLIPGRRLPKVDAIAWRKPMRYRLELTAIEARGEACDPGGHCDLNVAISAIGDTKKQVPTRGPDDTDRWELRYLLAETGVETELEHGFEVAVWDRDLAANDQLGRCQVRVDQLRVFTVGASADRRKHWHETCGKAQLLLTLSAEEMD